MPNSDINYIKESINIINTEEENIHVNQEINKQINRMYIYIPKILSKIIEYIKERNEISEESKFVTFAEELRNINQKIYDFFSDKKTSFQIGEKKNKSSFLDDFEHKYYKENKSYYEDFYNSFESKTKETINFREEYIKSFLNSVKFIFEEFIFLFNLKNDNILPYISKIEINSESHIHFFIKINNLYSSISNPKSINSNNDESEVILPLSKLVDIENISLGSSLSDFRINTIENVDQFIISKEDDYSIDFIKLNAKNLNDLSFLKNSKLIYLKRLELRTNNIKDISPLKYCSCENLINLIFLIIN